MFKQGVKYEWLEDQGYYVPEDNRDSPANRLRPTSPTLRYLVTDWQIVHSTTGLDDKQERERFDLSSDAPPRTRIHCKLENDRRRLHTLGEDGIEPFTGALTLDIYGGDTTEGQLRHWPGDAKGRDDLDKEAITGTLLIPEARMSWLVEHLTAPKAVFTLGIKAKLWKEEIALAFDEGWMPQDIVLKRDEGTPITGYELSVTQKPGEVLDRVEAAADDPGELGTNLPDDTVPVPVVKQATDKRLDYILYALVALLVITIFKR